jgi:hypothetical protein
MTSSTTGDVALVAPELDPPCVRISEDQLHDIPIHDSPPVDKMSGAGYDVVVDVDEEVS